MSLNINLPEEVIDEIAKRAAKKVITDLDLKEKEKQKERQSKIEKDIQYTADEVAELTKLSVNTINRHCRYGIIKASKIGKFWRITQENYLKYISNGNTEN